MRFDPLCRYDYIEIEDVKRQLLRIFTFTPPINILLCVISIVQITNRLGDSAVISLGRDPKAFVHTVTPWYSETLHFTQHSTTQITPSIFNYSLLQKVKFVSLKGIFPWTSKGFRLRVEGT